VDKIFKGAKPGELPVEQPRSMKIESPPRGGVDAKDDKCLGFSASGNG
jgi:hypothetical protein